MTAVRSGGLPCNLVSLCSCVTPSVHMSAAPQSEPIGHLNLEAVPRVALGLPEDPGNVSDYLAQLLSAYITSTVVSPSLAYYVLAGIPTVSFARRLVVLLAAGGHSASTIGNLPFIMSYLLQCLLSRSP